MKTKVSKRIISLVMTLSMLFTFITVVNVSAADDGILVDLDMNNITTDNNGEYQYKDYGVEAWGGATLSVGDRATNDKYLSSIGVVAFAFDEKLAADTITASFDIKSVNENWTNTSIWIGSNASDNVVRTLTTSELTKTWTTYTLEANFSTGEVKIYKAGALFDTVTVEALKGASPQYIGFTRWTVGLDIDNVKVVSGLNGTLAYFDMNTENSSIRSLDGGAYTREAYETDGTDKYFSGTGIFGFTLNKSIPSDATIIISYNMAVSDRNAGATLWYNSHSTAITSFPNYSGDSSAWTYLPKGIANMASYKVKLNLATGEAIYYKNEKQVETATLDAVKGVSTSEIGFIKYSDKLFLDNLKVEIAPAELISAEFTDAKNISLTYNGDMSSKGVTVTDSTGAKVASTVALADNTLTVTADSYFEAGETYTVTAKDVYGNVISKSLLQNIGTFADYKMNSDEGFSASELASYTDASQGTYYTNSANSAKEFSLDNTVKSGTIVIEYDINSVVNPSGGNYNTLSLRFGNNGDITLKKHATWTDTGVWKHWKFVVDLDNGTITTYKEGKQEGDVVTYTGTGNDLTGILLAHYHTSEVRLDNLKVTRPAVNVSWTRAYSENNGAWVEDIVNNIPTFAVAAFDGNVLDVTAGDGYTASISGKNVFVRPESGYFPAGTSTFTLNWVDEYGFTGTRTITVNASDVYAKCNGITVDGTTAKATFRLLKNKAELDKVEYIIASYNDKMLVNAEAVEVEYEAVADVTYPLTLDVSESYDEIRAFMWDGDLVPLTGVTTNP